MICGIDEAGRGPVLGNLVAAGLLCRAKDIETLKSMGVKDSKQLDAKKRSAIYEQLTSKFKYHVSQATPDEIDNNNLNRLEALKFAEIINELKPETAYIDCADVSPENFKNHIKRNVDVKCSLVVEHKADERHLVVSAASIIAKVERDTYIENLKAEYGEIGSGYPSDPRTIAFIEEWVKKNKSFPHFARKKWKTLDRLKNFKLTDF
jgi:ribonuclease HII